MSPLTLARKQIEAQALAQALELASGFLQIEPESRLILNVPEIVRKIAEMYAAGTKILRSDREIEELREKSMAEVQV